MPRRQSTVDNHFYDPSWNFDSQAKIISATPRPEWKRPMSFQFAQIAYCVNIAAIFIFSYKCAQFDTGKFSNFRLYFFF